MNNMSKLKPIALQKHYKMIICQDFLLKQDIKTVMEIPIISKIVLNSSSKVFVTDKKYSIPGLLALEMITGQKLKNTLAKKSIAAFKSRQNQLIGCKVTLRGQGMYTFLEKLIQIILPRMRNYSGTILQNSYTQRHYSLGIENLLLFPELEDYFEYFECLKGMQITIATSNQKKHQSRFFLTSYKIPSIA
jgi:large subunit ribosomal protein L5